MSAVRAGLLAFNERALIPTENYPWDDYQSRLFRYALSEAYYNNVAYRDVVTFSTRLKANSDLYKHVRSIYNPVYRLVEAYPTKVYGGSLDFEDLSTGAIPIVMSNPRLNEAIKQVWLWSNWRIQKGLYVRSGTLLGDNFLKVVDEPDRGKVRMEVLHPGKVKDITLNAVDDVKAVTIEYERRDTDEGKYYTYREVWGEDMSVATFRDNEPFAFYKDANGAAVMKWDNPYGFIPLVKVKHKDVGMKWGANAFHGQIGKVDELNDAASLLNDQVRKAINLIWYFAGVGKPAELDTATEAKDEVPAIYGPKDSQPFPMIGAVDITAAGVNIERMLMELERDMPELAMHRLREGGSLTAPGVRSAYSDAIDRFIEAQGIYDDGLIRAHKMAVSIGGYRGYDGFRGYNLDSYEKGDLEHFIKDRSIVADELSKKERVDSLQAAGAPIWLVMEELDFDQDKIDDVIADEENKARLAMRGFAEGVFNDTDEDEDTDGESVDVSDEADTQDQAATDSVPAPRPSITPIAAKAPPQPTQTASPVDSKPDFDTIKEQMELLMITMNEGQRLLGLPVDPNFAGYYLIEGIPVPPDKAKELYLSRFGRGINNLDAVISGDTESAT